MAIQLNEKKAWIERFFNDTGPTYDEVVHLFTLGIDRLWKKKIIAELSSPKNLLDLACGTGILSFAIHEKYPDSKITGVDITEGYLAVARQKAKALPVNNISFIRSPAEAYVSEERYDAVTTSYLPKYTDLPRLIRNLNKMMVPGGKIIFHDFTYPGNRLLQWIFKAYFVCIGPVGGWWYPEWRQVLKELPKVIEKTAWVSELTGALADEGFIDIKVESLTLQGAALVTGRKT